PQRYAHGGLLAGDQLLKVEMQHIPLDGMPLNLANQRACGPTVEAQLDHRAGRGDGREEPVDFARVDGERLWLATVSVNHRGDLTNLTQLAGDTRATIGTRRRAESCCCHFYDTSMNMNASQPTRDDSCLLSGGCVLPTMSESSEKN